MFNLVYALNDPSIILSRLWNPVCRCLFRCNCRTESYRYEVISSITAIAEQRATGSGGYQHNCIMHLSIIQPLGWVPTREKATDMR